MQLKIKEHTIEVQIVRKNNKNIYMRFIDQHTLVVTSNHFVSEREIAKIIEKNMKAIVKMWQKKEQEEQRDAFFCYLGRQYTRVFDGVTKEVEFVSDNVIAKDEKTLEKFYKQECLRVFTKELDRILPYFQNIPHFTLKIRTMKTRWGVNNRSNNTITLNSELLKKDIDLLDYVIIHELCHFYEANHSPRFWAWVSKYYPDYKLARKRLRS